MVDCVAKCDRWVYIEPEVNATVADPTTLYNSYLTANVRFPGNLRGFHHSIAD
jgi:hypothetical protein